MRPMAKYKLLFKASLASAAGFAVLSMSAPVSAETLQDALISAYNSNPRLMAERARLREIDETYIQARAQGRLSATAGGSAGYSVLRTPGTTALGQPSGGFSTVDSEPLSAQIQVIQPLYQGGRVRALKAQAKAGILAAREGLRLSEQNLFSGVAISYSDVLRDEEVARVRRNNVRVLARQKQAAIDRFDVGEGSRTDIAQAETRLAAADIGLAQADAQLQVSRAAYQRLVGRMPMQLSPLPSFAAPQSLQEAIIIGRDNSPQLTAAILNQKAAEAGIKVAKAASKPTVSISGTLSGTRRQLSFVRQAETGAIAAQVSVPIFTGGLNQSRVRAAKQARTRLMFEVRDAERALDQTITQIWAQLEAAKRSLTASRTQVKAAEFAFGGVELEQQLGTRSALDVLNAEQELLDAKLSVIQAGAAVKSAEFQLLSTIGGFDAATLQLPVDLYDPASNFEAVKNDGMTKIIDKYVPERLQTLGKSPKETP